MARHIVHFTGPINSSTCGNLINTCSRALQQGADALQLNIATMGGECSYGFTLYNFLRALPVEVHTHNLGTVESMGNIIFGVWGAMEPKTNVSSESHRKGAFRSPAHPPGITL